jgi:cell division protein FtsQ
MRWLVPVVLPVVLLAAGWRWIRSTIVEHPYFAVREIVAPSHGRIPADVVRAMAGVKLHSSIWAVDSDTIATRLRTLPWVRRAQVRRRFPARVVLDVREYRPVAILRVDDGDDPGFYYVARSGRPFARVDPEDVHDLPYISGIAAADLDATAYGTRSVRAALTVLRKARHRVALLGELSEVHVDRARGLTLMPVRPPVPIELGWDGFDTKLERLRYVLGQWVGREREMVAVSCVFDDDVVVRVASASPTPVVEPSPPAARPRSQKPPAVVPGKKPHRSTGA